MKQFFDQHGDRLSPDEKQAIWATLSAKLRSQAHSKERPLVKDQSANEPERGGGSFRTRLIGRRRLWAYPLAGALVTAVLLVVTLRQQGGIHHRIALPPAQEVRSVMPPSSGTEVEVKARDLDQAKTQTDGGIKKEASPSRTETRLRDQAAQDRQTIEQPAPGQLVRERAALDRHPGPSSGATAITGSLPPSLARSSAGGDNVAAPGPSGPSEPVDADLLASAPERLSFDAPAVVPMTAQAPVEPKASKVSAGDRSDLMAAADMSRGTGIIRGSVTDSTGQPLGSSNVVVVGTAWGAFTAEDGTFVISNVPAGTYVLEASMIAYSQEKIENVRVEAGKSTDLRFRLKLRSVNAIGEVAIVAPREVLKWARSSTVSDRQLTEQSDLVGLKAGGNAAGGAAHIDGGRGEGRITNLFESSPSPSREYRSAQPPRPQPPSIPTTGGSKLPNGEVFDSMFFKHYGVNPFVPTDEDALSTFAVDVDAASYTVARSYIDLGHLPPAEAVRVEEFVNFFRQGYPSFEGPDFRILVEGAPSPFAKHGYELLRIGIKAREIPAEERRPANLVFVIDVSGSMDRENRLELVKKALRILVDELTPDDRIGIVVFTSEARVLLEPVGVENRDEILDAIGRLHPENSTNVADGLRLGYNMARQMQRSGEITRIVLCSDGVANEGITVAPSILEEVRRQADQGVQLTAIGVGMGNFNDVLLEQLADQGDGNYYYVDEIGEARRVFSQNLTGTLQTIARNAKVQIEFDPRQVLRYRLLGFENRDVADNDFRNDRVDAGEIGAGHEVTALYEIKLAPDAERGRIATVRLRYSKPLEDTDGETRTREIEQDFDTSDLNRSFERATPYFRLDAAVAELAEILRGSYWARGHRIEDALPIARAASADLGRDRPAAEFVQLVDRAAELADRLSREERRRTIQRWDEEPENDR
jgi:Ca-activated chloride channel homolog